MSIFQSRGMANCPFSDLTEGEFGFFWPSRTNVGAMLELVALRGKRVDDFPLSFKSSCQTLKNMIVPPSVATLCETSFTTSQYVLKSCWSWAEGTGWVLAIPLVEIFWRWEHIIGSSNDEADVACLHFPEVPPSELSSLKASQFIHCPCLASETAFALLSAHCASRLT